MVNLDELPEYVRKALGLKSRDSLDKDFDEKEFINSFAMLTSPSKSDLQMAANILRKNGYQVINKRRKRK